MDAEEEEHKDVYAHFGLAAYWIQCLETSLINLLLCNGRVRGTIPTAKEFDQLDESLRNGTTLGGLIKMARHECELPDMTESVITLALQKRNFLIHHFFRERAMEWVTPQGRARMVAELEDAQRILRVADHLATILYQALLKIVGITAESVAKEVERLKQERKDADSRAA